MGHLVGTGPQRCDSQHLWKLDWLCLPSTASSTSSFYQWHHRLGHICGCQLFALLHRGLLGPVSSQESLDHCQGCRLGMQIQLPYHSSELVSQRPFDLVHSDIWGPAPFVSKGSHKYYIIFIDDFSHHAWIYFMKYHSEVLSINKNFSVMNSTHFDTSIE
jgi:hypothetical protein